MNEALKTMRTEIRRRCGGAALEGGKAMLETVRSFEGRPHATPPRQDDLFQECR